MNSDDISWSNLWGRNIWHKITTFSWLVMHNRILIGGNLQKCGMYGPYQCPLCKEVEETMSHILDACKFSFVLWDQGAMSFFLSARLCQNPVGTPILWPKKPFLNNILNRLREIFPNFLIWAIWNERNTRIFRAKASQPS